VKQRNLAREFPNKKKKTSLSLEKIKNPLVKFGEGE